jgi:hypothetical protein
MICSLYVARYFGGTETGRGGFESALEDVDEVDERVRRATMLTSAGSAATAQGITDSVRQAHKSSKGGSSKDSSKDSVKGNRSQATTRSGNASDGTVCSGSSGDERDRASSRLSRRFQSSGQTDDEEDPAFLDSLIGRLLIASCRPRSPASRRRDKERNVQGKKMSVKVSSLVSRKRATTVVVALLKGKEQGIEDDLKWLFLSIYVAAWYVEER